MSLIKHAQLKNSMASDVTWVWESMGPCSEVFNYILTFLPDDDRVGQSSILRRFNFMFSRLVLVKVWCMNGSSLLTLWDKISYRNQKWEYGSLISFDITTTSVYTFSCFSYKTWIFNELKNFLNSSWPQIVWEALFETIALPD